MNKETLSKMQQMKLYGMHAAFSELIQNTSYQTLTPDQLISQLVDAEHDDRYNRKINRLIKTARLRYKAIIEQVNYDQGRNLDKNLLLRLAEGTYMHNFENVFITGSTGVGKSYIACALGYQACTQQKRTMYFKTARLLSQLKLAKADGSYLKTLARIQRQHLLILDDFGLQPIDTTNSHVLLEIIEDRYQIASIIITSQLPVDKWYDLFKDKTVADAIMDRLVHKAHHIQLKGESMRKKQSK